MQRVGFLFDPPIKTTSLTEMQLENPLVVRKTMVHKLVVFTFISALRRAEMVLRVEEINDLA